MFKDTPIIVSKPGSGHLGRIDGEPRIVVANSGGEPTATGGYAAALILRAHMLASRTALWTSQEVMRRFLSAGALVRPGGIVFVTEPLGTLWEQSLARWDPWSAGTWDLRERQNGHFAPAWRTALLQAPKLGDYLETIRQAIPEVLVLGPVESARHQGFEAAFVSVPLKSGDLLGSVLRTLRTKTGGVSSTNGLFIEVDPADPGGQVA